MGGVYPARAVFADPPIGGLLPSSAYPLLVAYRRSGNPHMLAVTELRSIQNSKLLAILRNVQPQPNKVPQNREPVFLAFFGVKLNPPDIVFPDDRGEGNLVIAFTQRVVAIRVELGVRVDVVEVARLIARNAPQQRIVRCARVEGDSVPADVREMEPGRDTPDHPRQESKATRRWRLLTPFVEQ